MAEWGRKEYSKKWPSRTPVWTWTAILLTMVFFAGMLTLEYERSWTAAERLYLSDYLKSGARGKASATAASKYTLLEAVVGKNERLVIGDEIEQVPSLDGRPGYRLTDEGVKDGIARLTWVRTAYPVSNTVVSLTFRLALPALMLAMLIYTLNAADREQRMWYTQRESSHQKTVTNNDIESVPFVFPLQRSARIQDAIGLQWPAFAVAGIIAPVPRLFYSETKPLMSTWATYVTLALAVGLYWFAIAVWIDRRFIQRTRPSHSRVVRIMITVSFVLTALLFSLFLAKDLLPGGWPEGPQGAYGVTAWLALIATILLTEVNGFRRNAVTTPEL